MAREVSVGDRYRVRGATWRSWQVTEIVVEGKVRPIARVQASNDPSVIRNIPCAALLDPNCYQPIVLDGF